MNFAILRAAWRIARSVSRDAEGGPTRRPDHVMVFIVSAATLIVWVVTVGGCLGVLHRPTIVLLLALAIGLSVEVAVVRSIRRNGGTPRGAGRPWAPEVLAPASIVGCVWVLLAAERLGLPPISWDALTYHLRFPVLWLQSGRLLVSAASLGDPSHTYFPLCGEMLLYWQMLTTGTDLWSSLSQAPFLVAAAIGVMAIARRCGADGKWAAVAALGWAATPGLLRQACEPMVDVEMAAYFVFAAWGLIRWADRSERAWFFVAAASMGLLIGTKYAGIFYAAGLLPLALHRGIAQGGPVRRRLHLGTLLAGLAVVALVGGYSYARNWAAGGNPLLPVAWNLGPFARFEGAVPATHYLGGEAPRLGWRQLFFSSRALLELGPWFVPILALLPLHPVRVLARRGDRGREAAGLAAFLSVAALVSFGLASLLLPFREHRYFFPVLALAWAVAPSALPPALAARPAALRAAAAAACGPSLLGLFYWTKDLAVAGPNASHVSGAIAAAAVATVVAWGIVRSRAGMSSSSSAAASKRIGAIGRPGAVAAIGATSVCLAGVVVLTVAYETHRFDSWYRYWSSRHPWNDLGRVREDLRDMAESWRALADSTRGHATTVAYAGTNIPYALGGYGLENRVLFVPRNENADASYFDWGRRPPDPLANADPDDWIQNLGRLGVTYLCVYRLELDPESRGAFPWEERVASIDPSRFTPVFARPWARIYRVRLHPK